MNRTPEAQARIGAQRKKYRKLQRRALAKNLTVLTGAGILVLAAAAAFLFAYVFIIATAIHAVFG